MGTLSGDATLPFLLLTPSLVGESPKKNSLLWEQYFSFTSRNHYGKALSSTEGHKYCSLLLKMAENMELYTHTHQFLTKHIL